tara:strand:- start:338 stop:715 length:378 start_codon:yes stop_codon:yes gene_type:complete
MKRILYILILLFTFNVFSQDKIVKIPQSELDAFFLAIDTLQYQDSIKSVLIADLQLQNTNFFNLRVNDMAKFAAKDEEILLLNDQIKLYQDRLKITDKWYNKRWFGVVVGVVGTSTAIYLAGQIK